MYWGGGMGICGIINPISPKSLLEYLMIFSVLGRDTDIITIIPHHLVMKGEKDLEIYDQVTLLPAIC
jgi:hypothetical protein